MTSLMVFLTILALAFSLAIALLTMVFVAGRGASHPGERKRLTHSETAAVEDAIVLMASLAAQVGTILHILRRGPDAYPVDLAAGALWEAAAEALARQGHLTISGSNGASKRNGDVPPARRKRAALVENSTRPKEKSREC